MSALTDQKPLREAEDVVSRDSFIGAMRTVANSVHVVTTDGPAGRHGATVSAFCSVSADPPTVLVCLNADSRIARLVRANGQLAVNRLASDQAALASRFAGGDDAKLRLVQACEAAHCDRFAGVEVDPASPQPALTGALTLICRVVQQHRAGSHDVVIAEVGAVLGDSTQPLVYLDGGYRELSAPASENARG
ncbi:MAG: flavin reductase family protein [Pseudomonadota bacterium]